MLLMSRDNFHECYDFMNYNHGHDCPLTLNTYYLIVTTINSITIK